MTVFKTIFETAKTAARHPVTRKIVKTAIIIVVEEALKTTGRRGR